MAKKNFTSGLDSLLGGTSLDATSPEKKETTLASEPPKKSKQKKVSPQKEKESTQTAEKEPSLPESTVENLPDPVVAEQPEEETQIEPVLPESVPEKETVEVAPPQAKPISAEEKLLELIGAERLEALKQVATLRNVSLEEVVKEGLDFYLDFQVEIQNLDW